MGARVTYHKDWEQKFPTTALGRATFDRKAADIEADTVVELRRTGLDNDPPAREYLDELGHEPTDTGARVFTTAARAHFVEFGTYLRNADAPMRTAAARHGRFRSQ